MSSLPETAILPSGAVLVLKDADFDDAIALLQAVAVELSRVQTGVKFDGPLTDPAALIRALSADLSLDVVKNAILSLVASKDVEAILLRCMGRCLYNGVAAEKKEFHSRAARADYIPAVWEVMQFTLLPFFAGLTSRSLTGEAPAGDSRK